MSIHYILKVWQISVWVDRACCIPVKGHLVGVYTALGVFLHRRHHRSEHTGFIATPSSMATGGSVTAVQRGLSVRACWFIFSLRVLPCMLCPPAQLMDASGLIFIEILHEADLLFLRPLTVSGLLCCALLSRSVFTNPGSKDLTQTY